MERWKIFFQSSGVDVWTICERALTVAYEQHPEDFPLQRDKLAQKLFAPEKMDRQACEKDAPPTRTRLEPPTQDAANGTHCNGGLEFHKRDARYNDGYRVHGGNGTFDEAEALTEEMEEEILEKREVLSIKEILFDSYKSEKEIFDSLQRLNSMQLSVAVLKETGIGVTVNSLRKHSSLCLRSLAKQLISRWKDLVCEWVKSAEDVITAATATGGTVASCLPDDMNEEHHGLPSPPMDKGAFLAVQTSSIEMSQLFDFMVDDMSAGSGGAYSPDYDQHAFTSDFNKSCANTSSLPKSHTLSKPSGWLQIEASDRRTDMKSGKKDKKERALLKSSNGYCKEEMDCVTKNGCNGMDGQVSNVLVEKRGIKSSNDRTVTGSSQMLQTLRSGASADVGKDNSDYGEKFKASKRKLQQNYQQAENAKKQRVIQVMELHNLPKGGHNRAKLQPWGVGHK